MLNVFHEFTQPLHLLRGQFDEDHLCTVRCERIDRKRPGERDAMVGKSVIKGARNGKQGFAPLPITSLPNHS